MDHWRLYITATLNCQGAIIWHRDVVKSIHHVLNSVDRDTTWHILMSNQEILLPEASGSNLKIKTRVWAQETRDSVIFSLESYSTHQYLSFELSYALLRQLLRNLTFLGPAGQRRGPKMGPGGRKKVVVGFLYYLVPWDPKTPTTTLIASKSSDL